MTKGIRHPLFSNVKIVCPKRKLMRPLDALEHLRLAKNYYPLTN